MKSLHTNIYINQLMTYTCRHFWSRFEYW